MSVNDFFTTMFTQNVLVRCAMLEVDPRPWIRSGIYGRHFESSIFLSTQTWFSSNKGVKVVLDVPDTMWDAPSAEITQLKKYVSLFCMTVSKMVHCFLLFSVKRCSKSKKKQLSNGISTRKLVKKLHWRSTFAKTMCWRIEIHHVFEKCTHHLTQRNQISNPKVIRERKICKCQNLFCTSDK